MHLIGAISFCMKEVHSRVPYPKIRNRGSLLLHASYSLLDFVSVIDVDNSIELELILALLAHLYNLCVVSCNMPILASLIITSTASS